MSELSIVEFGLIDSSLFSGSRAGFALSMTRSRYLSTTPEAFAFPGNKAPSLLLMDHFSALITWKDASNYSPHQYPLRVPDIHLFHCIAQWLQLRRQGTSRFTKKCIGNSIKDKSIYLVQAFMWLVVGQVPDEDGNVTLDHGIVSMSNLCSLSSY